MRQREWGVVVVALALLTALIVPGLHGRRVAGQAVRGPEPLVGDCVVATPQPNFGADMTERPTGERIGCDAPKAARVVSRFARVEWPDRRFGQVLERVKTLCQGAARTQLDRLQGGPFKFTWNGGELDMSPAANFTTVPLTPGTQATLRGEQWLVCAANGIDAVAGGLVPDPMLASGSVVAHNPDPRWMMCGNDDLEPLIRSGSVHQAATVPCDHPHRWQLLGASNGSTYDTGADLPDLSLMCADYVGAATAMPEPTVGGALVILTASSEPGYVECLVSSRNSRTLSGSLLGLGRESVPWT